MASIVDWEDAALTVIAKEGLASLSIPRLAETLGVTKGSFYWHFTSLGDLVDASLRRWEEMDRALLEELEENRDARARLTALFEQAMQRREAQALFVSLSASTSREAAASLRRISKSRVEFLVAAYEELGLDRKTARARALLAYSAYVGALHLRIAKKKDVNAYVAHAVETLIP